MADEIPTQAVPEPVSAPEPQVAPESSNIDTAFSQAYQDSPAQQPTQGAPPTPQATAPTSELLQEAQSLGITINEAKSDADIARAIIAQYKQVQPFAQFGQQLAPQADKIREFLNQKPEEPAKPEEEWTPEGHFGQFWKVPTLDQQSTFAIQNGLVQRNTDSGAWEPAPGHELAAASVVQHLNEYDIAKRQHVQDIFDGNPYQKMYEALLPAIQRNWKEDMQALLQEQMQQQQETGAIQQYEQANASWLYTNVNGQRAFTPEGQKMYEAMNELRENGLKDPAVILRIAESMVKPSKGQPAAQPQQPPAQPVNPNLASAEQQQSFLNRALEVASHSPTSGGFTQASPDHPINISEGELDQLFVNATRAQKATAA